MNAHLLFILTIYFITFLKVNSETKSGILRTIKIPGDADPAVLQEAFSEPTALINSYGYHGENHTVTTDDGYILTIQRIVNENTDSIPFLLMHGMTCSSPQFIMNGPKSPAFLLANAGYDVWMGNFRGSPYTSHINYTYKQFWNFSWQEMAQYDLPATIDYVLNYTHKSKLFLAAQSLGTTVSFALLASQPSYNDKIACYFALTPVAFLNYNPNKIITFLHQLAEKHPALVTLLGSRQITYIYDWVLNIIFKKCVDNTRALPFVCDQVYGMIVGYNPYLYNSARIPVYLSYCHYGASAKLYEHYSQLIRYKEMRKFDYGDTKNMAIYGSSVPPLYNMSEITAPVVLFQSANDPLGDPLDVELVRRQLQNVKTELCPWPMCNHADIMISTEASEYLCDKLISYAKSIMTNSN